MILCLGHTKLSDYYELEGNEKFIYDPYPLIKTLNNINDKEDIGILGSSLTSIDVSVVLKERGHQGKSICYQEMDCFQLLGEYSAV